MLIERVKGEPFENSSVILSGNRVCDDLNRIHRVVQTSLVIQDRAVKFFLGREMPKDHRLRHAGGERNLSGRRAAKAALRKQPHREPQDLQPALSTRHARPVDGAVTCRDWFSQRSQRSLSAFEVSTHLPLAVPACQALSIKLFFTQPRRTFCRMETLG